MQTIGDRIRLLRKEKGLTVKDVAEGVGCHWNMIYLYEKSKYFPSAIVIIALSDFFGVTTDYILKGEEK